MPEYRGQFQYASRSESATQGSDCQIQFDSEIFTITPNAGAAIVVDLGDVDAVVPADYAIRLSLYSGATLTLQKFGKTYEDLSRELTACHRQRTIACLLLADLSEIDRFTGEYALADGASAPAELRVFASNLAVLPADGPAFQWRLADLDAISWDAGRYEITLAAGERRLRIGRLGRRTDLCHTTLRGAVNALNRESSVALHGILPFLNADELRAAAGQMREGCSASLDRLTAIHRRIPEALAANAVDETLRPYYDELVSRAARGLSFAGFKKIRPEPAGAHDQDADEQPDDATMLYWFFFPIAATSGGTSPGNVVAWEASSRSGRATYFFRLVDPRDEATLRDSAQASDAVTRGITGITRALGLLNFRRRPIYLSDDALTAQRGDYRYAIAARRLPELRDLRAAFLGRAIHSSFDAWRTQVNEILASAGVNYQA